MFQTLEDGFREPVGRKRTQPVIRYGDAKLDDHGRGQDRLRKARVIDGGDDSVHALNVEHTENAGKPVDAGAAADSTAAGAKTNVR